MPVIFYSKHLLLIPPFPDTPFPSVFYFICKIHLLATLSTSSILAQTITISYLYYCKKIQTCLLPPILPSVPTQSFLLTCMTPTHPQLENIQYFLISLRIRFKPLTECKICPYIVSYLISYPCLLGLLSVPEAFQVFSCPRDFCMLFSSLAVLFLFSFWAASSGSMLSLEHHFLEKASLPEQPPHHCHPHHFYLSTLFPSLHLSQLVLL